MTKNILFATAFLLASTAVGRFSYAAQLNVTSGMSPVSGDQAYSANADYGIAIDPGETPAALTMEYDGELTVEGNGSEGLLVRSGDSLMINGTAETASIIFKDNTNTAIQNDGALTFDASKIFSQGSILYTSAVNSSSVNFSNSAITMNDSSDAFVLDSNANGAIIGFSVSTLDAGSGGTIFTLDGVSGVEISLTGDSSDPDKKSSIDGSSMPVISADNGTTGLNVVLDNSLISADADVFVIKNGSDATFDLKNDSGVLTTGGSLFNLDTSGPLIVNLDNSSADASAGAVVVANNAASPILFDLKSDSSIVSQDGFALTNSTLALTSAGSKIAADTLLNLTGSTATITADSSEVSGAVINDGTSTATLTFDNASTWKVMGDSTVTTLNNNASTIDLRNATTGTFNTLTITGAYVGTGGSMIMNLGSDNSNSDKIVIASGASATGATELTIMKTGDDLGTANTVKVVDAESGATVANGAFTLKGGQVDNSAYIYKFVQGDGTDTQSYFLESTGQLTDFAKTLANEPIVFLNLAKMGMNSLSKRMGEVRENNTKNYNGLWVRTFGKDMEISDKIETDITAVGIEAGYDRKAMQTKNVDVYIGGMVGYIHATDISTKQSNGGKDGEGDGGVASLGGYVTVSHEKSGLFVDALFRQFWENIDYTSYTAGGDVLEYSPKRQMTALSLEVGKQSLYYMSRDLSSAFVVEPKVEVMYAKTAAKKFETNYGDEIEFGDTSSITAKLTLMLGFKSLIGNTVWEPYIQASIMQEFAGKTDVTYRGITYESDMGGTGYEFGGGMNFKIGKQSALYMDFLYETGDVVKAMSGNIGFRYTW